MLTVYPVAQRGWVEQGAVQRRAESIAMCSIYERYTNYSEVRYSEVRYNVVSNRGELNIRLGGGGCQ